MSLFRKSPSDIVAEAMRDVDREYAGYSEAIISTCVRNRHGYLLAEAERYGGPAEGERWRKLIRLFRLLAVRMLEVWLRSLVESAGTPVPIPGPVWQANDAPPEADDTTKDLL